VFVGPDIAPLLYENTISSGDAGRGGYSSGNGGDGGDSYAIFDVKPNDGAIPEIVIEGSLSNGSRGLRGVGTFGSNGAYGSAGERNF